MRRSLCLLGLIVLLCCLCTVCVAEGIQFTSAPDVVRPGKMCFFSILSPKQGTVNVILLAQDGQRVYDIYTNYPVIQGNNSIAWDGMRLDATVIPQGTYRLQLQLDTGEISDAPIVVGEPGPMLTRLYQVSGGAEEGGFEISYHASMAGQVHVSLQDYAMESVMPYLKLEAEVGENSFFWESGSGEDALTPGLYALLMTLTAENGEESMLQYLYFDIEEIDETSGSIGESLEEDFFILDPVNPSFTTVDVTPEPDDAGAQGTAPTVEATAAAGSTAASFLVSQPYSSTADGSYWSMTPGEVDDQVIWDILMQPITIYDGGLDTKAKTHAYIMEKPDGTGLKVAQLHAQSQGLHVIGEKNEYGYVLVEAFSNYDENYNPKTDEERAEAFTLKRGYVKASHLKTVKVMPDIAFVIDKLTQRMYIYENGVRTEELLIATGKIADNKYYNETIPGEYITISHTGDFPSGNMVCRMAIRINGGILLHEVPHKLNADGTRNYSAFEGYLGTKQSHGCVRIQRLPSPKMGYNQKWIWDTLAKGKPYKVIIWDDLNRLDTPTTWYPNPKN